MSLYELIRFIHIAAAVALLTGSVFGSPAVRAAARRARTTQELRAYLAIGRPLLTLEPAAAMLVLATGVYLTGAAGFWGISWVQVALVFWVVNAVVAGALVKPALTRVAAAASAAADGSVGPQLDAFRRSPRWSFGGDLLLANDAAMLWLMIMKPELAGSLLAVLGINLAVAAARAAGHTFHRASVAPAGSGQPSNDAAPRPVVR